MKSVAGIQLWLLHKNGYKFTDRMGNLTPLQEAFIISAMVREIESQNEDEQEPQSEKASARDEMEKKMRERKAQLQWQSRQNS